MKFPLDFYFQKPELFYLYPNCRMEHATDRKTSKNQVLSLQNEDENEVLIQPANDISTWVKELKNNVSY